MGGNINGISVWIMLGILGPLVWVVYFFLEYIIFKAMKKTQKQERSEEEKNW